MVRRKPNTASVTEQRSALTKGAQASFGHLDRIFHEKARLGIMTVLAGNPQGILFTQLKEVLDFTDGNLNRHLKVLVDAAMVSVEKSAAGRNAKSAYQLTALGLEGFENYLAELESVLVQATTATENARSFSVPKNAATRNSRPATS